MDFVQLVALVGRNGQRYRLAHVCRCFVGGYGAVLGRHDGDGVVNHLEQGGYYHVAGGYDKGVFALGGYCYSHLGCAIHYNQLVELITLVGRNGQRYRLAIVCRFFVGGYISAYRRHNDNVVVYRLVGGRDFHVAGGHDKGVFALGGYCYSHLRLAVQHMELVELVSRGGCDGQRYRLAVFSRFLVSGYGAVLSRCDGNRAGYILCAIAGYRIELRPYVRVVVCQRHDGVLELAHYGLVRCVRPTGGVGAGSHLLKGIVGVCRTATDRIRVYAHTFGSVPLHNDAVAVVLRSGEGEVRHYVE